ncbi:unnamed protein product [Allacma fusca]|uniref:Dynein heavy chain 5, axonemal n=1 Tax=Allacma fusca TaxID=39272 RepID=A0A8J2LQ40_9HEXA|nr:unnamed protein product [Allacma fusca]
MSDGKRRAESDARLEYVYSFLSEATSLGRHEVSDMVHSGGLVARINMFFQPRGPNTLLLFYQEDPSDQPPEPTATKVTGTRGSPPKQLVATQPPKKKIFFTDGTNKLLTGTAIYYLRVGTQKPVSEEGYYKEVMCGTISGRKPGEMLRFIFMSLQHVYIPSLMGIANNPEDYETDESVRNAVRKRMIPALRSFCSCLRVWEAIQIEYDALLQTEKFFNGTETIEDLRIFAKDTERVAALERSMKKWSTHVSQIVSESERLRKELDSNGPQDEVEYWKRRASRLALLLQKIHSGEMKFTLMTLQMSGSNVIKPWRELEQKVSFCFTEAKDTAAYIDRIDKICHTLYLDNPTKIKGDTHTLLQTVMMIQTSSMYYNSSEKISHLLVKITNQMIHRCKEYLTCNGKVTIWAQRRHIVRQKIVECIDLNKAYKKSYQLNSNKTRNRRAKDFCISEHYVFGKFDSFCERLKKILIVFDTLDGYETLFSTHVCGLLWDDTVDEKEKEFVVQVKQITGKNYNSLDYRNKEFDADYVEFTGRMDELKIWLKKMIEKHYHDIWESPQAIKFLKRIEEVNQFVQVTTLEDKYERIAQHFAEQIQNTRGYFQKNKRKSQLPRGMPPVGGKTMWIRSMVLQLETFTRDFAQHPKLKILPQFKELVQDYNVFALEVASYEIRSLKRWYKESKLSAVEEPLKEPILVVDVNDRPSVNMSSLVESMIAEGDSLVKLDADIPLPTKVLLLKTGHFRSVTEKLDMLLDRYYWAVKRVNKEVRPLLFLQVIKLASLFQPGIHTINWTSILWENYFRVCLKAIEDFNTLVARVHDVYTYQIQGSFSDMEGVILCAEFEDLPWTLDEFLDRNYKSVRDMTTFLNEKSMHIRDLVDDLIKMIHKSGSHIGTKVIRQFGLDKNNHVLSEIFGPMEDMCSSPDKSMDNSNALMNGPDGGYGTPSSQRNQPDWSMMDQLYDRPHCLHNILGAKCSKELKEIARNSNEDIKYMFSRQIFELIVRIVRASLCLVRRRFVGPLPPNSKINAALWAIPPEMEDSSFTENTPVFILQTQLLGSAVSIKPTMEQIQEAITQVGRVIVAAAKGISQWVTYGLENHENQINPINEKKARRRQLYRSISQDRVGAPFQIVNFFSQVIENKEIAKVTAALSSCTQILKDSFLEFMRIWEAFDFLWSPTRYVALKQFAATNPSWCEFEDRLNECWESENQLKSLADYYDFGAIRIISDKLKQGLLHESRELILKYGTALKNKYRREMEFVLITIQDFQKKLESDITGIDDVRIAMETLNKFREIEVDLDLRIPPIEEAFYVVAKFDIPASSDEIEEADSIRYQFSKLQLTSNEMSATVVKLYPTFNKQLLENLEIFKGHCDDFCREYETEGPMVPGLTPRQASDKLALFQNRFDALWRRNVQYASGQQLFGMQAVENVALANIKKELNLLQKLYRLYNDVIDRVSSYYDILWKEVNIEEINNELLEFQNRCRKLPKGLKEWPAFFALKKTIDDFNDIIPLLELMSNKSMKPRHWQKIMDVTSYNFDIEKETLCLKDILDAPLLQFKDDIEDVCISALKERDIEAKLRQVTNEWSVHELTFISFKTRGELLLRGDTTAETIAQLEDSLMILGSLLSNRYNAPFKKQIQKWVSDLSNTNEILERWLLVQNMWVYLEAVFVGGDIAKQLPKEAKRFSKIDQSWQKIMQRAHEVPGVVACCVGDDTLKAILPHLQDELEVCQKSLSGYLEKKRLLFPRFFFVSDPALLEILGQASDSHTIQSHLLSIFDNISTVTFHETEYNKILAINSQEGESIKLERSVKAEGSVEVWLNQLLQYSKASLHSVVRESYMQISEPDYNLIELLEISPAQVGLLTIQIIWTRDSESALTQAKHDRKIMSEINNKFLDILNQLIDQTTRNLTKIERVKFETLITIHVHQRDIFDNLCRMNVKSGTDFEWVKQCRFYFKEDTDVTEVFITDVYFAYQNEYLGCTDRLVITPLTDRCYITLAQALSLSMGGCPAGPAGTGKTETIRWITKDLVEFIKFNRIDLPVLSVAAQQIAVVLTCRREHRKTFVFTDGDVVEMNPEFGIFLTMNPGYAGRHELPENLKIQFRTVAMMVPDRQIIIRVKLASCGFLENITLARKFYTLYKLCEEQLTKQVHYDFGLRNILSVLRTLGTTKRANVKDAESTIVMRVLRDMNLSKLIDEDEPLFMSLVTDLFPNVAFEKTTYQELTEAIAVEVENQGLVFHDPWVLKLIQMYETQEVRHGIMTLGPSGAGKTTCIHTLMKALTTIGIPHKEMRMNPKAITAHQMFGRLDVATNDWTDGIFSALWRKTLKVKKGQPSTDRIWLVLDGPVDSIWIENLNSVLDDNKTLTLANGDRLPMSPLCKIIFEPHNIDNASPATVSRSGMVYMSSSGLNWSPIVEAWLKKREPQTANILRDLIQLWFYQTYDFARQNLQFRMPILECNIIAQMLALLEGLLPLEERADDSAEALETLRLNPNYVAEKQVNESEIEKIFLFCLSWSVGAFLETEDRIKFDSFLRTNENGSLPMPKSSIFNYVMEGNEWKPWQDRVASYVLPENYTNEYSSILVPTIDNVRTNFLVNTVASQRKAVLLIGEQGSAKTVMVDSYMKSYNPDYHLARTMNFSFATTPYQFQKTIESYMEKRVGTTFGPSGGKSMTLFIDDVNLPEVNTWGDQVTNEIVRQTIEMKGFYSLEKPGEFSHITDMQFIGAMIHPGAGRNDIPSRLKRHFCIFNCTLPTDESIDKIFQTIGMGHYSAKRGFTEEVRGLIERLVVVTRLLWMSTRKMLLPTPAKFHYIFNLRDLSRIWQGMISTLCTVIDGPKATMQLWIHECSRVLTDRFTDAQDKTWFELETKRIVEKEFGKKFTTMIKKVSLFVDFMRDAPEPTGEEGEGETEVELPKVYEPLEDFEVLKERLIMFLDQYNDMVRGSPMNLVFFPDAMINLVKISRIIRCPGGNALLVGVGGSGKQSLTKLSSFIAGYKTYQITLTRSYNLSNFLEDIKLLYRTCGAQGKGTAFIFSDQDIKEEVFLEYLNNVLSSGLICNLFNRDEYSEIIAELTPIMKRENSRKVPTPENVFNFFIQRMKQYLHVILCFSPVGEKFRSRALKFPGLISGCTVNWFFPWPKDALISVAEHFLQDYPMECADEAKKNVIFVLGSVQDSVASICVEYFQRLRRSAHVTPKSYLNFLASYKSIYGSKLNELKESAQRMDLGLLKLKEAAAAVANLRKELAKMEQELQVASKEAERVLVSVKERAEEAEGIRNRVQQSKVMAEQLVSDIEADRTTAEQKLEAAKPALEEAENALNTIQPTHIATVRKLGRPPHLIMRIMDSVLILFQKKLHFSFPDPNVPSPKPSWPEALKMMASTTFLISLQNYPKDIINEEIVELLEPYFRMEDYNMDDAKRVCGDVAGLLSWTKAMAFFYGVNKEVLPLKSNLAMQEARLKIAVSDLARLEQELTEKEGELKIVKDEYDVAFSKTQLLMDAADSCRKKMSTAMALIDGLSGENKRWTEQSRELKDRMGRLVGDILKATAFLSYSGPFNQEYRALLLGQFTDLVEKYDIPRQDACTVLSLLLNTSDVAEWTMQGLPNDELSIENAVIVTKGASYPLMVDPQSQGKAWIKSKEAKNNLCVTSLNHKYFRTHLEDSLSLGKPLLIEDVGEELDPVIDNVLEKNFIKSGTIEKVVVGDKECDVMPGFMLYVTTKLANPFYTPEISAKTCIIDFTVTMKGLEDQLLGRVILMEKSELESERMALFESVMQNKRSMKSLEDSLLEKLSSSQGSLVDDEELIRVLRETKTTSENVKTKLQTAEETDKKITIAREEFRPIASRGSVLYFLVVEMAKVNVMYQTSLKQFLNLFDGSIKLSEKSLITSERIDNVLSKLNWEVWQFVQRSLFVKDRFLFTLMMTLKIDLHSSNIQHEEFMVLIKGGASLDLSAVRPKPFRWISDVSWLNLVELSKLKPFKKILDEVSEKEHDWKVWQDLETPEVSVIPCGRKIMQSIASDRILGK